MANRRVIRKSALSLAIFSLLATHPALALSSKPALKTEMLVSTDWLAAHLSDANVVVLCIASSEDFYSKGHIPGARQILLSDLVISRDGIPNELPETEKLKALFEKAGVSNDSRVILYGERYGLLAARTYFTLDYMGLGAHTALLDGGLEKWHAEHRPESTKASDVKPGKLTLHLQPHLLTTLAAMRAYSSEAVEKKSATVALLDARPEDEFSGSKISEDVPRAGHIPGAASLFWLNAIVSKENPVLRPVEDLRGLFKAAGVAPDLKVVTYCRSGMQSSMDYFFAKYLGYDASMYDASFYEWSRQDLPVVMEKKEK